MKLLILYAGLALGISFLCSMLEAIILSVRWSHINLLIKQKKHGAVLLKALKKDVERPLAAILTLNTIANTIGAAGVGAQALKVYGDKWLAMISIIFTLVILVFSEIIPKSIGASFWKRLCIPGAFVIRFLITVMLPFVFLLRFISNVVKSKKRTEMTMTREEMIVAAETGVEEGILAEKEQRVIKNLLRLNAILAEDVMTPRSVVFTLSKNTKVIDVIGKKTPLFFSRIPVYEAGIDDIIGMVLRFKILEASANDEDDMSIEKLVIPIQSVSEKTPVAKILDEFIKKKEHIFIVTDDHGGTAGIITLEDVIETLLGVEIVDEFDSVEDMRKFALDQWENRKKSRKYQYVGVEGGGTLVELKDIHKDQIKIVGS
ncbi:MAG: HlyC/CorC family transporter [Deltaproteobacteria bacterium]|nr:HlyC/CorC family transporter [Deltaproteobacteria bacterium]